MNKLSGGESTDQQTSSTDEIFTPEGHPNNLEHTSCRLVSAPLNKQASVAVHTLNTQTSHLLGSALTNKQVLPL